MKRKYFIAFSVQKSMSRHIRDKKSLILLEKLKISNFEMLSWDGIFVPFSEKFICISHLHLSETWLKWIQIKTCGIPKAYQMAESS